MTASSASTSSAAFDLADAPARLDPALRANGRPRLRITRAVHCEPPYDDELDAAQVPAAATVVALARRPAALADTPTAQLRALTSPSEPGSVTATAHRDDPELEAIKTFAGRLVQGVTEVLAGDRQLTQLMPYLSHRVYGGLARRVDSQRPVRPRTGPRPPAVPVVRSVHVCRPAPDVAEVSVVVRRGDRVAAVALRLERVDTKWRCTILQVG